MAQHKVADGYNVKKTQSSHDVGIADRDWDW